MPWTEVNSGDTNLIIRCSEILIKTAQVTHAPLTNPVLDNMLSRTTFDTRERLFRMWIFREGEESEYCLVLACDLSIRRIVEDGHPTGMITQRHWGITVGVDEEFITAAAAYLQVKSQCKEFLTELDNQSNSSQLHIRGDAEADINLGNQADQLFTLFLTDAGITSRKPVIIPVSEYLYYRKRNGSSYPNIDFVWTKRIVSIN